MSAIEVLDEMELRFVEMHATLTAGAADSASRSKAGRLREQAKGIGHAIAVVRARRDALRVEVSPTHGDTKMRQHDHREFVEGCYRCELGRDEALAQGRIARTGSCFPGAVLAENHDGTIAGGALVDHGIVGLCPDCPAHLHRISEPEPTPDGWTSDTRLECCACGYESAASTHQTQKDSK